MTIDTKDMLNSILSSISRIDYVRPDDIPNIDLYMDQVTTFMEKNWHPVNVMKMIRSLPRP